jgi:biotin-(acetyl-CoA carboxylase) ligase
VLRALERWLGADQPAVLTAWRERDALEGREVSWSDGAGRAVGIDDAGRLLVGTPSGTVALDAGEVHLRGAAARAQSHADPAPPGYSSTE